MTYLKRTKIIATLGPATQNPAMLERMMEAGLDIVRANFSHGTFEDHKARLDTVRACAVKCGREVGILVDLQGPKIRIARFKNKKIILNIGEKFILDAGLDDDAGDETTVGIDYKQLPQDVNTGDRLLLDDGRLSLLVDKIEGSRIICTVQTGGELSSNKGINRFGGGLSAPSLTDKDRADIKKAALLGADYVAVSFPRTAADMIEARRLLEAAGSKAGLIAKIERKEAVTALKEIIQVSDAVMVARGDLGVEIGDAELPAVQKHIIHQARSLNKAVITATQMMESMIQNTIPTRAEVFDVANAVLDGTDAVMLSAETAVGEHPDKVIAAMSRICMAAEQQPRSMVSRHRLESHFEHTDEAIAMATMYTANHLGIKAILAMTESGTTPLWMSRIRSGIPIYALSMHHATLRRMTLYRGVYPTHFTGDHDLDKAIVTLKQRNILVPGDRVIVTYGDHARKKGGTNTMKIVRVH
ncbi:MAG: pyruvate kinase [Gammaproteobacteria bacterium]